MSEGLKRAGLALCLSLSIAAPAAAQLPAARQNSVVASVVVEPATKRTLKATIVGFGRVQANPDSLVTINAPHSGFIRHLHVRAGQAVAKGVPLFDLAPTPAAALAYKQAQQAVDYARGNLRREQRLFSEQLATHDQVAKAETALKDAEAALQAQERAGAGRASQVINAPFAGTVTTVSAAEGEQLQQGAKALTLARSDALVVRLGVEPQDIAKVSPGMSVKLAETFDAAKRYGGRIIAVDAVIDPQTRLVDVLARLANPDGDPPMIGTIMRGEILLRSETVLTVPREAVLYDRQGAYVFVVRSHRARRVAVKTGLENESQVAVDGALKPGDFIVVQGNYELKEGMRVQEVAREAH